MSKLFDVLSSFGLTVACLLLLMLLTFVGTLAQVEHGLFEAQRLYFDSWMVLHPVQGLRIPLPGGQLVMAVLFVNLILGGFVRIRRTRRLAGIYIAHTGIALLLLAGLVKLYFSADGYLAVFEGDRTNYYESHFEWELAVRDEAGMEVTVPDRMLREARDKRLEFTDERLPFSLVVERFVPNSMPRPMGEGDAGNAVVVDGFFLDRLPAQTDKERERAGAYVSLRADGGPTEAVLLWGSDMLRPKAVDVELAGKKWLVDLRRRRFPLPFTVRLEDFRKIDHPRTNMPQSFESDVTAIADGEERDVTISMNEPLRDGGHILFQSSFGPPDAGPGDRMYSQFSVVRNPSDQWPLWSCIVIAIGLLLHFGQKLARHIRREVKVA